MSDPLDDYLEHEKTAGFAGDFFGREGLQDAASAKGLGRLAGHVALLAGGTALVGAAKKAWMAATKSNDHKKMLAANPDLVEAQQADPTTFNQNYSSLRNMNPTFASDPVVAGSYMRRMSEFPHNAGNIVVDSLQHAPKPQGGVKDVATGLGIAQQASSREQRGG